MITKSQIDQLAEDYKIDSFTIFREYLQLIFLNYLYQNKKAGKIFFKGGTAIHLLLGSLRFSEDLDFSTEYNKKEILKIIKDVQKELRRELPEIKISPLYQGKKSIRFRLKYLFLNFKYPFVIRLDFREKEKPNKASASALITKFPIAFFPLIVHFPAEEILAEKIRAFLTRAKGRDLYDLWFLLQRGIRLNKKYNKKVLSGKIKTFPVKILKFDLAKFLPEPQRKIIPILKTNLLSSLEKTIPK